MKKLLALVTGKIAICAAKLKLLVSRSPKSQSLINSIMTGEWLWDNSLSITQATRLLEIGLEAKNCLERTELYYTNDMGQTSVEHIIVMGGCQTQNLDG